VKKIHEAVYDLKSKSGFVWDNEKGMNVTDESPEHTQQAWAALVKVSYASM
jgi:hypothetical protein